MSLPSPRTMEQGMRDIMVNAINMMSAEDLKAVHREIGPFCLEVILNATAPRPTEATPAIEPKAPKPVYVPVKDAERLIQALQDALGADGWTEPNLREVFSYPRGGETALALLSNPTSKRLRAVAAKAIEEFLK